MQIFVHFAYLDPGTGSLIVQSIIGIAAGVAFFGRRSISSFGHKLKNIFSKPKGEPEEE